MRSEREIGRARERRVDIRYTATSQLVRRGGGKVELGVRQHQAHRLDAREPACADNCRPYAHMTRPNPD